MMPEKLQIVVYFALFLLIGAALNTVAVISPSPLDVVIGYLTGLFGFLAIRVIRDVKLRTLGFIILPVALALITSAILSEYCQVFTQQNFCKRNLLVLSSIPLFAILFHWGLSFLYKQRA